jgi:hypothetical protein
VRDGVYVTTRRDGLALVVMYLDDRPVEVLCAQTERRPGRRTTKRIGDTITSVLDEVARRRREMLLRMVSELPR